MWAPTAKTLLPTACPIDCPVDVFLARATLNRQIRSFLAQPPLARQAMPFQNGDVHHSNFYKSGVLTGTGVAGQVASIDEQLKAILAANPVSEAWGDHAGAAALGGIASLPRTTLGEAEVHIEASDSRPTSSTTPTTDNDTAPAALLAVAPPGGECVRRATARHASARRRAEESGEAAKE